MQRVPETTAYEHPFFPSHPALFVAPIVALVLALAVLAAPARAAPNIGFFYGANPPWDELAAWDVVVVDPDHVKLPVRRPGEAMPARPALLGRHTELFAYVSLGEVGPGRAWGRDLPREWRIAENSAWGSSVIDQARLEWPAFFAERVVAPLWAQGYRGFFLDTLDSFHLAAKTPEARAAQVEGMVRVIETLRARFPGVRLIYNRGFEILPRTHQHVWAVAFESLYRGWDQEKKTWREVPAADRDWLLGQLRPALDQWKLPVIAIDYVAPGERELARDTARRIAAHGLIPFVSVPELDAVGLGAIEPQPRKILSLYDPTPGAPSLRFETTHRLIDMPLNWMGYVMEPVAAGGPLPDHVLAGRYAGLVVFLQNRGLGEAERRLIERAIREKVPVAAFGTLGIAGAALERLYGLKTGDASPRLDRLQVRSASPLIGHEGPPQLDRSAFFPLRAMGGEALLTVENARGEVMQPIALMPWGGYALWPFAYYELPGGRGERWTVDPFEFLRRALRLPEAPAPDLTTESGRRLLMVHIDGDGFASRAEIPGAPFSGDAMRTEFIERYRVPHTVSIIQGEIAGNGLYKELSPALEAAVRRIFALPHVELASHSYSHPFRWRKAENTAEIRGESNYSLMLPGYSFDARTEIEGSVAYIDSRLAPPGKKTRVFLWTGDCDPSDDVVERAWEAGLLNMNGGETTISRSEPSLTRVAPMGVKRDTVWQIYAPNQNENVYTNLWTGPFYGFERVIETFELTDTPRRLKPVNIYYHSYSASKRASIAALHKVYRWALQRPHMAVYASEYALKALDFTRLSLARTVTADTPAWIVRGADALRTLRMPEAAGVPEISATNNVIGHATHSGQRYLHLAGSEARIRLLSATSSTSSSATPPVPFLADANARVESARVLPGGLELVLHGHQPVSFALGNATGCEVSAAGRRLTPLAAAGAAAGGLLRYETRRDGTETITVRCGA